MGATWTNAVWCFAIFHGLKSTTAATTHQGFPAGNLRGRAASAGRMPPKRGILPEKPSEDGRLTQFSAKHTHAKYPLGVLDTYPMGV
ncbi:hypothetical protein ART_2828 [Arthrobacter sp. PAMC 25486]|nr:hypothetical protein ART_2828 [Arthrobacter sp. PAMC 25486]